MFPSSGWYKSTVKEFNENRRKAAFERALWKVELEYRQQRVNAWNKAVIGSRRGTLTDRKYAQQNLAYWQNEVRIARQIIKSKNCTLGYYKETLSGFPLG